MSPCTVNTAKDGTLVRWVTSQQHFFSRAPSHVHAPPLPLHPGTLVNVEKNRTCYYFVLGFDITFLLPSSTSHEFWVFSTLNESVRGQQKSWSQEMSVFPSSPPVHALTFYRAEGLISIPETLVVDVHRFLNFDMHVLLAPSPEFESPTISQQRRQVVYWLDYLNPTQKPTRYSKNWMHCKGYLRAKPGCLRHTSVGSWVPRS